ncbi:MAG: lytic transglycosylase domain-containing protein [Ruminococcaceae bacterium]|nr:lytic transglycosylase domain-containing protein [Oscillospiraceae bacterium]
MKRKRKKKHPFRLALIVVLALLLLGTALFFLLGPKIDRALYPREYQTYVERYAKQYEVPENLIYAVIRTESDFDPEAVSSVGAVGLMQMMPSTFRWLSDDMLGEHLEDGMLYDPETNIRYGVYYLRRLYDRYGDWPTACAAYNAGNGRVDGWLEDSSLTNLQGHLIIDRIPIGETRAYVRKIQKAYQAYQRLYPSLTVVPFS